MTTDNRTNGKPSISPKNEGEGEVGLHFSDEQVEAAAKAIADCHNPGMFEKYPENWRIEARAALVAAQGAAPQQIGRLDLARHYWRSQGYDYDLHGLDGNNDHEMGMAVADAALAALAAAQGAAPQAAGAPKSTYINPNLPGMIRNLWKDDPTEKSVQRALGLAGDLIQELIDLRAALDTGKD